MTCCLDYVTWVQSAVFDCAICLLPLQIYSPLALALVPASFLKIGLGPDVKLKQLSVGLEPLCKLVFWGEDRPVGGEGHVG